MTKSIRAALLAAAWACQACGGSDAPAGPSATPTPPPDYSGTWSATLDGGRGSFTFVVAGNTITSLAYTFSYSAAVGGSSCSVTNLCSASAPCAVPQASSVSGNTFSASRGSSYTIQGTFTSLTAASGSVTYTVTGNSSLCNASPSQGWTATKTS